MPFAGNRVYDAPWKTEYDPNELVWYFSYGSNLSEEVFEKRRKVKPHSTCKVVVPDHIFSFAHDAFPYIEPCFATCLPRSEVWYDDSDIPDIRGLAFQITRKDFQERVLATEGGWGYNTDPLCSYVVAPVRAYKLDALNRKSGKGFTVLTLVGGPARGRISAWNCPSLRYFKIVVEGAEHANLVRG